MQKNKTKRFYKVGERVFVKPEGKVGVVKELIVKPSEGVFKAIVEIVRSKDGGTTILNVSEYNLWEIDKDKTSLYKAKHQKDNGFVKKPTILFAKVREDAIIPSKNVEDAGYDIYANFRGAFMSIKPNTVAMIPTGIASSILDDWVLIVKERGSTGIKGMSVRAGVIDSGYRGEIFIPINNTSDKTIYIAKDGYDFGSGTTTYPYEKAIAQLLLIPVPKANVKEISYEELQAIPSSRGRGALGSSNK